MKKLSLLLLCMTMALSIGCQKEPASEQLVATTKAAGKCDANCRECQHKDGKCTCIFCNCTRYCSTCGSQTYPINRCVCSGGGGGTTPPPGPDPVYCSGCQVINKYSHCVCNTPPLTTYPIEYMDKSQFLGAAPANTQRAAYAIVGNYRQENYSWPGHEVSGIRVSDPGSAQSARQTIDFQLSKYRQPVIVKVRCVSEDGDNMYDGLEFWVVITGTGGPNTYYTYMELVIENEAFRDLACDTQANRFTVDDYSNPVLRDKTAQYTGSTYVVVEVLPGI